MLSDDRTVSLGTAIYYDEAAKKLLGQTKAANVVAGRRSQCYMQCTSRQGGSFAVTSYYADLRPITDQF